MCKGPSSCLGLPGDSQGAAGGPSAARDHDCRGDRDPAAADVPRPAAPVGRGDRLAWPEAGGGGFIQD